MASTSVCGAGASSWPAGSVDVGALLVFLLIVALLFELVAVVHALWWIAIIALIVWVIGFMLRPRGGRWYYW